MRKALITSALAAVVIGSASACVPTITPTTQQEVNSVGSSSPIAVPSGMPTDMPTTIPTGMMMSPSPGMGTDGGMSGTPTRGSSTQVDDYSVRTIDNSTDPTFNQLLGINNNGEIAGYFGSGAQNHPNKGYRLNPGAHAFNNENYPGSVQTQVTGINDHGLTVGFFSAMNNANMTNDNTGFYDDGGHYHKVSFPTSDNASPPVDQLLGVNDSGTAVGFYTDSAGNNHGYEYSIGRNSYHTVHVSGSTSTTAAAINNNGDIAGFYTNSAGTTDAFLLTSGGRQITLAFPGASMTQALGVNDHDEVVGVYQVGSGSSALMHGFTWTPENSFTSLDDPAGIGATTINGVNDAGDLVGFYTDGAGNTDGMLATPSHGISSQHLTLHPMPSGTVSFATSDNGTFQADVNVTGLTPGSVHTVEIDAPGMNGPVVRFADLLTADSTGRAQMTVNAAGPVSSLPSGSRFVIRLGETGSGGDGGNGGTPGQAAEAVAQSSQLSNRPFGSGYELSAVNQTTSGQSAGQLTGQATIIFDADMKTLTVTLNATGLTPGAHAAHIHSGSCQSQGAVLYMLMDFQADSQGNVVNQTRTITGVNTMPANGTWYLNVHMGDSSTILANGGPTLAFRPLLCANG